METAKSKSQQKREAAILQKLGVELIDWSLDNLNKMPLSEYLKKAILDAKSINSHGAIRRQHQLIGKLMRTCDTEAILTAYQTVMADENSQTAAFHQVEQWRTRLIHEGRDALTDFVNTYQPDDLQCLKQLIKKAIEEKEKAKDVGAARKLFRHIRSYINRT